MGFGVDVRILVALSGGVDSAVAAARLVGQGHEVIGVHLRTGVESEDASAVRQKSCCGADDARDARAAASALGVPFYVVDVADAFSGILDDFVAAYAEGRTPNPCVLCNRDVKFGRLREIAADLGAERIATGHYARTRQNGEGRWQLLRARDPTKDQSYVLYPLDQAQLACAMFPLGDSVKDEVREEARGLGLAVADKPDSQDLCFVPTGNYRDFLRAEAPEVFTPGSILGLGGEVLGVHDGAANYTMGQRKGLPAMGVPHYVHSVDDDGNVVIAPRSGVEFGAVRAHAVNWIAMAAPQTGTQLRIDARIRHAGGLEAGLATVLPGGDVEVAFDRPAFAPARGQALVLYDGDTVLCGGTIGAATKPGEPQAAPAKVD